MINTYEEAKPRIPSQKERILNMLKEAGSEGVTNSTLSNVAIRFTSRIQELYQEGYKIDIEPVENGIYRYILVSEPAIKKSKPEKAVNIVRRSIKEKFNGQVTADELINLLNENGFNIVRRYGAIKSST